MTGRIVKDRLINSKESLSLEEISYDSVYRKVGQETQEVRERSGHG